MRLSDIIIVSLPYTALYGCTVAACQDPEHVMCAVSAAHTEPTC